MEHPLWGLFIALLFSPIWWVIDLEWLAFLPSILLGVGNELSSKWLPHAPETWKTHVKDVWHFTIGGLLVSGVLIFLRYLS
jgi:hypothetical protein